MIIDLPIIILYDCSDLTRTERAASKKLCTLRYETEGDGSDAVLFGDYPPDGCTGEPAQALLAFLPARADKAIRDKAARNPIDYMAGTDAEREAAQADADQHKSDNGQFGVGS